MKYTLRQLEVFLAVARTGSVSRAATELALSQSAVSGSLGDLERQFDVLLFDRVGKRVQLNELGRALRPQAEALLAQAQNLEDALHRHAEAGLLRVGATLTIGNYLAVPLMAEYMARFPATRVTLDVENTAAIARKIANFELDVALVEGELAHPELEVAPWRDDELVVFAAPGHPLAQRGTPLDDADLLGVQWIVREAGSGTRQAFDHAMHGILPQLDIRLELQHTEAIKGAVQAGLGVGCISRVALADAFARGTLVPLAVPQRDFRRKFFFVLHRQKYRGSGIARWLALCREAG